jgi:hypothetical protein
MVARAGHLCHAACETRIALVSILS